MGLAQSRVMAVRLAHAAASMFGLTLAVFLIVRVTGDPVQLLLPDTATPEDFARARAHLLLDRPIIVQYLAFLDDVAHGEFGTSISLRVPVRDLVQQRFPATLALGAAALVMALLIGIPLGVYSAYWRGGWVDRIARLFAVLGQSAPSFWVGLILILLVAVRFRLVPAGGFGGADHLILPAFTLAWAASAGLTRLVRSSMIEVLETDYVRFLRIKGVPEHQIIWKHALRNAGLSALTFVGVITAGLLTGSVVVETVFVWPGMGQLMAQAIGARDFPVVQGVVLIFSSVYIVVNLLVDVLYALLNPRLR